MSSFGEPELLDDLVDHWNASNHKEVSVTLSILVMYICTCFGRLLSNPNVQV